MMNREQLIRRGERLMKAGGPYIGPRGGKWADPQHTIPWEEPHPVTVDSVIDRAKKLGIFAEEHRIGKIRIGPVKDRWIQTPEQASKKLDEWENEGKLEDYKEKTDTPRVKMRTEKPKPSRPSKTGSARRASTKQVNYAWSLMQKLRNEDYGTFTTYGYNFVSSEYLRKMSSAGISSMINHLRREVY